MKIKMCKDVNEYIEILNKRLIDYSNKINDLYKQLEFEEKKNESVRLFIETYIKPHNEELYNKYLELLDKLYYEENNNKIN